MNNREQFKGGQENIGDDNASLMGKEGGDDLLKAEGKKIIEQAEGEEVERGLEKLHALAERLENENSRDAAHVHEIADALQEKRQVKEWMFDAFDSSELAAETRELLPPHIKDELEWDIIAGPGDQNAIFRTVHRLHNLDEYIFWKKNKPEAKKRYEEFLNKRSRKAE